MSVDSPSSHVKAIGNLSIRHFKKEIHQKNIPAFWRKCVQRLRQFFIFNVNLFIPYDESVSFTGVIVVDCKLLHGFLRQFTEIDFSLLSAPDFPIDVIGLILQSLFTETVKCVLLVLLMTQVWIHFLTSLNIFVQMLPLCM